MVQISRMALGVVLLWTVLVIFVFFVTMDIVILMFAAMMVTILYIIPLLIGRMNRSTFHQLGNEYREKAVRKNIRDISPNDLGSVILIEGKIKRQRLKWLTRPQFLITDATGEIVVNMLYLPLNEFQEGDYMRIIGAVSKRWAKTDDMAITAFEMVKLNNQIRDDFKS